MKNEQAPFEILFLDEFAHRLKIGKSTVHDWKKRHLEGRKALYKTWWCPSLFGRKIYC